MAIRVIVRDVNVCTAANAGGPVETTLRTFDIEAPELEEWLREPVAGGWTRREVIGVELLKPAADREGGRVDGQAITCEVGAAAQTLPQG